MTAAPAQNTTPQQLLLATDLSARCDRALDRAAQLAREWQAPLTALHVLDPTASPDQTLDWVSGASDEQLMRVAQRQLAQDLAASGATATLRLVRSDRPASAIRETAASTQADLVITGISGNETLGRFLLGSTVESLARALAPPLLVVRRRAHGPYRRIVVACDFSEPARHALLSAARLFPGRELVLYHAHGLALSALADAPASCDTCTTIERTDGAAFLAQTPLPAGQAVRQHIECGAVASRLPRHVREHDIDLVVIGSHGRSGLVGLLLGSTAARLMDWLPCDTLLVRATGAAA